MSVGNSDYAKEYAFVRESLRRSVSQDSKGQPGLGADPQDLNWQIVERMLAVHGVYPLVASSLLDRSVEALPEDFLNNLNERLRRTQAYNVFLVKELDRVIGVLNSGGIPALAFKGPVLGHTAYRNIGIRSCEDLDILIPPDRFADARERLISDGYRVGGSQSQKHGIGKAADMFFNRQASFTKGPAVYNLDIHVSLMPPLFRYPVEFDELMKRSVLIPVAGHTIRTFSPEDTLQLLCFHGIKNRWNRLKYIVDIGYLIRNQPLSWDTVVDRATEISARRILWLGTYLSMDLLGTTVPASIKSRVLEDRAVCSIGTSILKRFPTYTPKNETSYKERAFLNVRLQETVGNRLRYVSLSLLRRLADWS